MSIVRIGLAETKHFAEGYAAIFGGKKKTEEPEPEPEKDAGEASDDTDAESTPKKAVKPAKKKGKK